MKLACRRYGWVLALLLSCTDDGASAEGGGTNASTDTGGLAQGEPCQADTECAEGLFCDAHPNGSGRCEPPHDHEPDCNEDPAACSGTAGASGDASGDTSGTSDTSGIADTSGSGDATEDTGATTDTGDDTGLEITCGDMTCAGDFVCVEDPIPASCTLVEDPKAPCPEGQSPSQCGGAGIPCCCEPPPPSEYRCESASGCDGPATCECLGMICTAGTECIALGSDPEHHFRCDSLPKP